jgi:hypothetical protein
LLAEIRVAPQPLRDFVEQEIEDLLADSSFKVSDGVYAQGRSVKPSRSSGYRAQSQSVLRRMLEGPHPAQYG